MILIYYCEQCREDGRDTTITWDTSTVPITGYFIPPERFVTSNLAPCGHNVFRITDATIIEEYKKWRVVDQKI